MDTDESISDAIVLLGRQFNKVLRRMDRRPRTNVKNIPQDISRNNNFQKKT
ncbi:gag-pol polyprotein, partial [Trifolium medium]|nr:gag-pol polyprotein [Trifolium medium]